MLGVQRIHCYPFKKTKHYQGKTFHNKNQQDVVSLIPAAVGISAFKYDRMNPDSIEAARVELFFEFTMVPSEDLGESNLQPEKVRAAFIKYISPFADALGKPLTKATDGPREGKFVTVLSHKLLLDDLHTTKWL